MFKNDYIQIHKESQEALNSQNNPEEEQQIKSETCIS